LLFEQETNTLKFAACQLEFRHQLHLLRVPIDRSLSGWVYKNNKSVKVDNAWSDPRIFGSPEREFGFPARTALIIPLAYRGEPIGVLQAVEKQNKQIFDSADLSILEILAFQVSASILGYLLYDEIKRSYEEVQALERMKSNFIAIASHELRTPLGLILGHASFIYDSIQDPEVKGQLQIIIKSANRLKALLEDLSNVNNFQSGALHPKHQSIIVNHLLKRVADAFQADASKKQIALSLNLPKEQLVIQVDEEKIIIAIYNLVKNAITYTNQGGKVWITAEKLPSYVQICVEDNGIGIPAEDLPHVFTRFYQVDSHLTRRHGGIGLGLSVAKAMIEIHKGQIWVESESGKGSKFSILLPTQTTTNPLRLSKANL
jgi:signal transduction histidine kinase